MIEAKAVKINSDEVKARIVFGGNSDDIEDEFISILDKMVEDSDTHILAITSIACWLGESEHISEIERQYLTATLNGGVDGVREFVSKEAFREEHGGNE